MTTKEIEEKIRNVVKDEIVKNRYTEKKMGPNRNPIDNLAQRAREKLDKK
jgi:hypothetical protein